MSSQTVRWSVWLGLAILGALALTATVTGAPFAERVVDLVGRLVEAVVLVGIGGKLGASYPAAPPPAPRGDLEATPAAPLVSAAPVEPAPAPPDAPRGRRRGGGGAAS